MTKRLMWCVFILLWASAAQAEVQLLPAWKRLTPTSVKGSSYAGGLYAAKGETESFQLAVFAPKGSYQVWWSAPAGLTIKAYSEQWCYPARTATYYPDGLLPLAQGGALAIADSKPGAVWFDVTPSRTLAAGSYKINVQCGASTRAITLTVWNVALPEQPRLKSAIGLWPPTRGKLAAEKLLLEHRLMPTFIDASHAAKLSGYGQTQAHVGFWAGLNKTTATISTAKPTTAQVDAAVAKYKPLLPYSYLADEVYNDACSNPLRDWSAALAGKVDRMVTIAPRAGWEWLDIFVELPKYHVQSATDAAIARGSEVWLYQTLSQDTYSPKWLLHYPYPNWVLMSGFLPYRHRLTGLLYWRADYEKAGVNPWTNADAYGTSYPGEAQWILPLRNGQPSTDYADCTDYAPTIRLKWLRDGVDIYDYLSLLKDRGQKSFADTVTATVATSFSAWSKDPAAIEAARRKLGAKLNQ